MSPAWILTGCLVDALAIAAVPASADQAGGPPAQSGPPPVATPAPPPQQNGLQLQTGDFTWKFGGYIKVDVIHDFDDIGSEDFFDPRTIPTTGAVEPGDSTRIHARQTRFNVDVRGPTTAGPVRGFVEGDFFGTNNAFRLRHAYGTIGHVLGGQTWSTFMDEAAMPETLDFESPTAFPLVRQAQVRWTVPMDGGDYFAVAIEDPEAEVEAPAGVTGTTKNPLPDVTARWHWAHDRGHVQLGAFGGLARFVPDTGSSDDAWLWGVNLSTELETWGKDSAIAQVTYGDGVGRYRGGLAAAPDANGNLDAIPVLGVLGSYEHHWSEEYRSTIAYSWAKGDPPDGAAPTDNQRLEYLAANLIWQFADRAWAGIEYLYGYRETVDDEDGSANRLQLSIRFDL